MSENNNKPDVSMDTEDIKSEINETPEKKVLDAADSADEELKNEELANDDDPEDEDELDDEELENAFDPTQADEHQVFINVLQAYDEAKRKRDKYKKIAPLFVIISGVVFLTLIFTLSRKIDFLIIWILSFIICAVLMIRAEYVFNQFKEILGIIKKEDDEEYEEDEEDTENKESIDDKESDDNEKSKDDEKST